MRLSSKYRIRSLCEQTASHLATHYVTTLEEFDIDQQRLPRSILVWECDEMGLLPICRETGMLSMLPTAFYYLATYYWNNFPSDHMGIELDPEDTPFYESMSKVDLLKAASGRESLRRAIGEEICRFLYEPSPPTCCSGPGDCRLRKLQFLGTAMWREWCDSVDALNISLVEDVRDELKALCAVCKIELESSMQDGRQRVWMNLPSYFGLASWETLKAMTAQAAQSMAES